MTTRIRGKKAAAEMATQDEEIRHAEPLADPVPEDLAAAAAELRQAGKDADEEAARLHGEAATVVATSRTEADRIVSEGQARALPLVADARALERKAAELGGRSKHMEHAARQEALAKEHEAAAEALAAELGRLTETTIAELDTKLAELGAERERLAAAVGAARGAGDVAGIAEGRRLLNATVEAMEGLGEQRAAAMARARQIGDGTETGPGELRDALTAAETHRAALTKALDELFPDRPGAEHRRALGNLKDVLEGNMARITEEAKTVPPVRRFGFADAH